MTTAEHSAPDASVIVPVFDDPAGLALCLDALAAQSLPRERFEVIVVDNGSSTSYADALARLPLAQLIVERRPGSYNARNAGWRASRGGVLAFTDADCRPHPDWLRRALEYFGEHPEVDSIGGAIQLDRSASPTGAELYERLTSFRQQQYVEQSGFAATANMIVRRGCFESVGPFRGDLKSSGDRDWGHRVHASGRRMDYVTDVIVAHPPRATLRQLVAKRRRLEGGLRMVPAASASPYMLRLPCGERPRGLSLAWALIRHPAEHGLDAWQVPKIMLVAGLVVMAGLAERARLLLGGSPVR